MSKLILIGLILLIATYFITESEGLIFLGALIV